MHVKDLLKSQRGDITGWALGLAIAALVGVLSLIGFAIFMFVGPGLP